MKNICGLLSLEVDALPPRLGRWEMGGLGLRCFIFRFDRSLLFGIIFGRSAHCFWLVVAYVWGYWGRSEILFVRDSWLG
jgi:hypothetical protein